MAEQCIKVVVRVRPNNQRQSSKKIPQFLEFDLNQKQIIAKNIAVQNRPAKVFCFDDIFLPDSQQEDIFEATGKHLVLDVLQGYNGTIFAYGQTGSGKTYTMMGNPKRQQARGVIPRCFKLLLEQAKLNNSKDFLIMCSYIQLYNQEIRDLLSSNIKNKLDLRESPEKGIFIKDLMKFPVTTEEEMLKYLHIGNQNRSTGQTLMNLESSRSHCIFTIYVESLERKDGLQKFIGSKFNLVDLAGSERQSKTGSTGQRFFEATKINLSLTALGKVISTLVQGRGMHIPYRDSKLTRLLQDSLGGNAKTIMIATISPSYFNYEQTVGTLKYASRAKYITNAPTINEDPKDALLREYESEITRLRRQLKSLQQNEKPEVDQLLFEKEKITKEAEQEKRQLMIKIRQLEEQLISPSQLSQKLLHERERRQQKLSFMERNYRNLQDQVKEMRHLLAQLRRKYKNASKEIFQLENQHQKEKEKIQEEFIEIQKQNIIFKSVLNILFTEKQLSNILSLGSWETDRTFKLPAFYFKDRNTLAFPCSGNDENTYFPEKQKRVKDSPFATALNGFRSNSQQKIMHSKKRGFC